MTRKDYILIARALRDATISLEADQPTNFIGTAYDNALARVRHMIVNELGDDNPRFNRKHFLAVVRGEKELTSRPSRG